MSNEIVNGKLDVMGINIDISPVLGQKIIDQYVAQLKEEDVKTIMDYISQDLFTTTYTDKLVIKESKKNHWGSYETNERTIGEIIRTKFNERIKHELVKKVEEIIASADYQKKIDEIANELVDYSINGYKEDMKNRIRERLVGNVMDAAPCYGGISLHAIIEDAIDKRFQSM